MLPPLIMLAQYHLSAPFVPVQGHLPMSIVGLHDVQWFRMFVEELVYDVAYLGWKQ